MGISRFRVEELKSLAFGSIAAGYAIVGAAYAFPISKIHIFNNTDVALTFSFDGVTDHVVLPASGFMLLDITIEGKVPDYLPKGDAFYVKRLGTPTTGSVYLTAFYGVNR